MAKKNLKVFLDTSVIFAAVLSETGGARVLFRLGEIGMLDLVIGPNVLRECEDVIRRKKPDSLPGLALLLELGLVEIVPAPAPALIAHTSEIITYKPDAIVLAEAIGAEPDWLVTHDKAHILKIGVEMLFRIGTPGDLIQALSETFSD